MNQKIEHDVLPAKLTQIWLYILTAASAIIAIWVAFKYANQPILEHHGFRQTQTALSAYWMLREGWHLDYQTPVGGYPWTIPFEFPIYQMVVAFISWVGNFPLVPVGRLVSFAFLLACAIPAYQIIRRLALPIETFWLFCTLLWSSPLYLFWGRTFMIETTALFFTFAAIPYALDLCEPDSKWSSVSMFCLWGVLGMLQKVTTAAPAFLVMGGLITVIHVRRFGLKLPPWKKILQLAISFGLPFIIALVWSRYTDNIKLQSTLGAELTSSQLTFWNFGSISQRLTPSLWWKIIWERTLLFNVAGIFGILLFITVFIVGEKKFKNFMIICFLLYLMPISIFFNLHAEHDYYQSASTIFVVGALTFAISSFHNQKVGEYPLVPLISLIFFIANVFMFQLQYAPYLNIPLDEMHTTSLAVSNILKRYTPENSAFVAFGEDWSSEIPYYAERKAFNVPAWLDSYENVWNNPAAYIGNKELGALVFCLGKEEKPTQEMLFRRTDITSQPGLFLIGSCYIWLPGVTEITLVDGTHVLPVVKP